jgi:glutaredoxin
MLTLILYTTDGCHLCEEAKALLLAAATRCSVRIEEVDIADDDRLLQRYGVHIPVIARQDNGRELGWPFGLTDVVAFLR